MKLRFLTACLIASAAAIIAGCGPRSDARTEAQLRGFWVYQNFSDSWLETAMAVHLDTLGQGEIRMQSAWGEAATGAARIPIRWLATTDQLLIDIDTAAIRLDIDTAQLRRLDIKVDQLRSELLRCYKVLTPDADGRIALEITDITDDTYGRHMTTLEADSTESFWLKLD